jgi:phosphate uptake regulator
MAKRSSRSKRKRKTTKRSVPASTTGASPKPRADKQVDLATEYRYVAKDLERIGIIAAVLIGALVVLSFFL